MYGLFYKNEHCQAVSSLAGQSRRRHTVPSTKTSSSPCEYNLSPSIIDMSHVTSEWLRTYPRHAILSDKPNYFATRPQDLICKAKPIRYSVGTGHQLFTSSIIPTCRKAEHELVLVTCFWAESTTREAIADLLRELSSKALARNDDDARGRRIQVRICFSSTSILQKLFQTSSLDGKIYPAVSWTKIGLPRPEELRGLDLVVKSIFVLPFSVMHPKFVIVDRRKAFVPSCNVSWEAWFEGCIEMEGDICSRLHDFYSDFWTKASPPLDDSWVKAINSTIQGLDRVPDSEIDLLNRWDFDSQQLLQTIPLPSPHHINPRFSPFSKSNAPQTPLNTFILQTINSASLSIHIQTPNLTCRPLIRALLTALERGVSVTVITSSRLMILEQLVTALTITEFEVYKLTKVYKKLLKKYTSADSERQIVKPGRLRIGYYHPRAYGEESKEPAKSHLKLTVVDEEVTILGSGNMDRASWYTSQELGIAIVDVGLAAAVLQCTDAALVDRVRWV